MMKMMRSGLPILLGLCVVPWAGTAWGQSAATVKPPDRPDRAFYPTNPHLVALETRLRPVIAAWQPGAEIELTANRLVIRYRSAKFSSHLYDTIGSLSREAPERFPSDFSEFEVRLGVNKDTMYYRADGAMRTYPTTFGSTSLSRYNLRVLARDKTTNRDCEVPPDHWAYRDFGTLSKAGLLPSRNSAGGWNGGVFTRMFRFEFAIAVVHLTYLTRVDSREMVNRKEPLREGPGEKAERLVHEAKLAQAVQKNPEVKDALSNLQAEFAPDVEEVFGASEVIAKPVIRGQIWQPYYEYIDFASAYGKGVDKRLVEKIQEAVATYANETLVANTLVNSVVQKN